MGGGGQPRGLASLVLLACCRVLLRAHGTEREDLMTQRSVHPGVRRRPAAAREEDSTGRCHPRGSPLEVCAGKGFKH